MIDVVGVYSIVKSKILRHGQAEEKLLGNIRNCIIPKNNESRVADRNLACAQINTECRISSLTRN